MYKYEMDPMSIVEDTERTQFSPQTDKVKPVYPPPQKKNKKTGGYKNASRCIE